MKLPEVIPDVDAFIAMEPEELGLRILPVLDTFERRQPKMLDLELGHVLDGATQMHNLNPIGGYPPDRATEVRRSLREA
jgi:hypothetical protein